MNLEKNYYYVRPNRANWAPTVQRVKEYVTIELLKGRPINDIESSAFSLNHCVSGTYWKEFWKAVITV